jgi:5S rRNA maturation endonuclease (ribonuclease M5)
MFAPGSRRKIWGLRGHNKPRLYPAIVLKAPGPIIIVEGEWDALLTIQNGFAAITRTSTADCWLPAWDHYFEGREVYLCHDLDHKGSKANRKIYKALKNVATSIQTIKLPMVYRPKNGFDLTDYWLDNHKPWEFKLLMKQATA